MRMWIPGGRGMLGQAVQRVGGHDLVVTGRDVDVADAQAVEKLLNARPVDAIVNCAGYTKVDLAEKEEAQAHRDNAIAPGILARAARARSMPFVHVSTDYVFPGDAMKPYVEDDATGPLSAYGRTKLAGERAVVDAGGRAYVLRTSWLVGPGGKNFVTTMLRLFAERDAVSVVDDQVGRPTYTDDLARALLLLATSSATPGTYHFANVGQTTWHGFASAILDGARRRGMTVKPAAVTAIPTSAYPTPAKRPAWSVLSTTKIERALGSTPRAWSAALDEYLDRIARGDA